MSLNHRFYYYTIESGTILFHGTRYNTSPEVLLQNQQSSPLWLSRDRQVAEIYAARQGRNRCLSFVTMKALDLFDFTDQRNFRRLLQHVSSSDRNFLEYYVHRFILFGKRAIFNTDHGDLAHEVSRILCQLGLDGWYIPSGHVRETVDDITGEIHYSSFHEEVLLCKPWQSLQFQGSCRLHDFKN